MVNQNILINYKSELLLVYMWFTWFTCGLFNILFPCKHCKPQKNTFNILIFIFLSLILPVLWFTSCKPALNSEYQIYTMSKFTRFTRFTTYDIYQRSQKKHN